MTKKYLGLVWFSLFLLCIQSYAQKTSVTGVVMDSSANVRLANASVVLLQDKDSFIVADTRADKDGKFAFHNLSDTARYVLFFSYPKYADYAHRVFMRDAKNNLFNMNKVNMILKEKLLQEVIVKSQVSAIKIKGDTTEYTADSFKVQANATVEELLRQLPGLQVDQYGNITAQGQKVKKVLVDGEEFFGDDPTLVTRNLRADMIDKVQVYDKKSDAAAFTGIEDGVKDKTINLKIKEDKNHGVFGKVEAGGGTDQHYNAQGMLNAFKGKRKMAVYGTTSNIGRTGLGSADKEKIGSDEDGNGTYSGKGLPTATSAGLHYDKKWGEDKNSINGNYKFNMTNVAGNDNTISQNNLPTGLILSNANNHFENSSSGHKANAKYIHKFDTTSTVTVYTDGSINNSKNKSNGMTRNLRGDSSLLYNYQSFGSNDYDYNAYNLNLSWEKKLKKYGRTLSFYLNNNFSNDASLGESYSKSDFYDEQGLFDSTATLHLQRKMNDDWRTLSFNANYTEPLTSKLSLLVNYKLNNEELHDDKRSFDLAKDPSGATMDKKFSTLMNSTIWGNQAGAALNYASKKFIAKIGNNVKLVRMNIEDSYRPLTFDKQFWNWNPQASLNYKFSNYKSLNVSYNGNSTNPERTQLLPLAFNNGQLSTYLPNLDLKNSFSNNLTAYYNTVKVVSQTYAGGYANYSRASNPIVNSVLVDTSGAYTYQFINMQGYTNQNYNASLYYSKKIQAWDLQAGAYGSISGGNTFSLINRAVNKLNYTTYTLGLEFFKTKMKAYSLYLTGTGGYTLNSSSLQPGSNNNYFFYNLNPSADIYFLKKFQLHTDLNYLWQQKSRAFSDNFTRTIWNAWVGRNFLKNDQLTIKISCNDILNENNGYARTANNTFFSENRYTTIRRFFMVGATWSFTKFNNLKQ
ncbi:outer membrane beta-barrel protein [Niabella pedocola]|uniref:Outer membrane beta-barrel protein n=1 Tax=Niabella pedocola TaxID=1752077 RepID=A0ABS8PRE1_9BACT|nr:TonB-dependent receptor [Niabella pedocola]MCD2423660.1 outer membrane beta-barrel protein [Niabella pedocola]